MKFYAGRYWLLVETERYFVTLFNFLKKDERYFGPDYVEYDCIRSYSFGFWFFNVACGNQ